MTKKLFSVLLAIVMLLTVAPVAVFAEDDMLSYLTYSISNGKVTITGCDGAISGDFVIPDTIEGCPVTAIDTDAFNYCAFTSVTIPDSITSIFYGSFRDWPNLQYFQVDENNQYYSNDSCGVLFNKDKTELITYPAGRSETAYVIPDGVELIGDFSFENCSVLTDITIPYGVTEIGMCAFYNTSIKSISIPDSVTGINAEAFSHTPLESICIPDSVTVLSYYAFKNCTALKSVTLGNGLVNIDGGTFEGCTNLEYVSIGDSVKTIYEEAFAACINLRDVIMGKSIETIASHAFQGCRSLNSITIPESVINISWSAFDFCLSLDNIYVDENNPNYSSDGELLLSKDQTVLFNVMHDIKGKYSVPDYITEIEAGCFATNMTIQELDFSSVETIAPESAVEAFALEKAILPESVKTVGSLAFFDCVSLKDIYIYNPEAVLEEMCIGYKAFDISVDTDMFIDLLIKSYTSETEAERQEYMDKWSNCIIECEDITSMSDLTIHGYKGSTAETYAIENHLKFVPLCEHHYIEQVITPATYTHSGMSSTVCEFCGEVLETYEVPMLTIEESEEKADEKTDVSVIYPDGAFDGEAQIQVTPVSDGDAFKLISHKEGNYKVTMFDISVTVDGEKVQPNGTVLVKMPLPKGYNQNKCVVYYVADDGTMEELTTYHFKDGYVYFETNHFSYYAIVEDVEEPTNRPSWMDNTLNFVQAFIDFFNRIISWFRTLFGVA